MSMVELKNCENCKNRKMRKSRGYPCMCCELLNPISFNSKWEEDDDISVYHTLLYAPLVFPKKGASDGET